MIVSGQSENSITLVSCLYDIGREHWGGEGKYSRSWENYVSYFKDLAGIQENLHIFLPRYLVEQIRALREPYDPGLKHTVIEECELHELPAFRYFAEFCRILADPAFRKGIARPDAPEMWNPLYLTIIHSKVGLLLKALQRNRFGSDHMFWIDAGLMKGQIDANGVTISRPQTMEKLLDGRLHALTRNQFLSDYANPSYFMRSGITCIAAGFFGGCNKVVQDFCIEVESELKSTLAQRLVGTEQSLYSLVAMRRPDIFHLYFGDYLRLFEFFCGRAQLAT